MKRFITIYLFELKKIYGKKMVWSAVAVMIALQLAGNVVGLFLKNEYVDADGNITYQTGYEEDMVVREAAQAISGRKIDDSLLSEMRKAYEEDGTSAEEMTKDRQTYREIYYYVVSYTGFGMVIDLDEEELYQIRHDTLDEENQYWELNEEEIRYWEKQENTIEKPFVYEYNDGTCRFFARINFLSLLWLSLIGVGLANFFGEEHIRRTDQLILCSKNGKEPLYLAKMAAGITFGIAGTVLFYLVQFLTILAIYGMSGFDLPLQIYLWESSFPISLGGAIIISFFLSLAAAALGSVFIMLLSELFRNGVAALSVMLGATLFTMFVSVPVRYGLASQLYNFMPMRFFSDTAFLDKRLFCIFGKYFTGVQAAPVFYLVSAVILAGIGYKVYKEYQVSGR